MPHGQQFFDDNGRPVAATMPEVYDDDPRGEDATREGMLDRIAALLDWLARHGDVVRAGERSLLLAHICGRGAFKTDSALARKLNMTAGRVSQLRKEIQGFLPGLNGNRRQKIKARRTGDRKNNL